MLNDTRTFIYRAPLLAVFLGTAIGLVRAGPEPARQRLQSPSLIGSILPG
jgi:hypothetical protein